MHNEYLLLLVLANTFVLLVQQVVHGPMVVLERVPGGTQLNDDELVSNPYRYLTLENFILDSQALNYCLSAMLKDVVP